MNKVYLYVFKDTDYDCEDYYIITNCDCKNLIQEIENNFDFDYDTFKHNVENNVFLYNYLKENKKVNLTSIYDFTIEFLDNYSWLVNKECYKFYY